MINVKFREKNGRYIVTVRGHAKSGENGRDLVCAAVSTLTYTLAQNIRDCYKQGFLKLFPRIKLSEGDAVICYRPQKEYDASLLILLLGIQRGFQLLESNYSEYMTINSLVAPG